MLNEGTKQEIEKQGVYLFGVVPQDEKVFRSEERRVGKEGR